MPEKLLFLNGRSCLRSFFFLKLSQLERRSCLRTLLLVRVDENVLPTCQLLLVVCGAARSEVGGLSSTGKSFRVVRACARCVCLVSSGQKSLGGGFPFSLLA